MYAVIFIYEIGDNLEGYAEMDKLTLELVSTLQGYLGYQKAGDGKNNIFISYWESLEHIDAWRKDPVHTKAKAEGANKWYKRYISQICKVEQSHEMKKEE
jgi:heme-degrading monooxygenase HmoA